MIERHLVAFLGVRGFAGRRVRHRTTICVQRATIFAAVALALMDVRRRRTAGGRTAEAGLEEQRQE